jgi:hypothetical protein
MNFSCPPCHRQKLKRNALPSINYNIIFGGKMSAETISIIVAIVFGPVSAIIIYLWSHRKSFPPPQDLANALNLIDVVFEDCPTVINKWHQYYDLLCQIQAWEENKQKREHIYLELISEIARSLGYLIQQTDIDKFYLPRAHGEQAEINAEIQREWLRVLKNTSRFLSDKKDDEPPSS